MNLTPREFYNTYGVPFSRRHTIEAGGTLTIPANMDRYLLTFWYTDTVLKVIPADADAVVSTVGNWSETTGIITLTHALHGALVNIGWEIVNDIAFAEAVVVIIEGYMVDMPKRIKRKGKHAANT